MIEDHAPAATVALRERAAAERLAGASSAVAVSALTKTFLLPHQRQTTARERALNVFKRRDREVLDALRDVSFGIRRGEFFGVVGRNGSGKSTLLRCIAGIYVPDGGKVVVDGPLASFISLGIGFNPELSARENAIQSAVLFGLDPREARERVDEIVAFAELERFADQRLKHLSSGMAARLAFAVTIHVDADILLFDEVLAVGDASFRGKCVEQFDGLRERGKTIVLVSHDVRTIERSCDRALLLDGGRLVDVGAPGGVLEQYERITADASRRPQAQPAAPLLLPPGARTSGSRALGPVARALRRTGRAVGAAVSPASRALGTLIAPSLGRSSMFGRDPRRFMVLTRMLAATDFRLKYENAVFNYAWAVARPAALFTVMLLVFGTLGRFDRGVPHYPAYLVLGIVMWMFFAQAVASCVGCLTRRGSLLQKLPFPRLAVPFSAILAATIDLAVNLVVVFGVLLATGVSPRLSWLELPLLLAVVAIFAAGIGLTLGALYVRYRDLDQVWMVASQTIFYLTPIFYVAGHLPKTVREPLLLANPLASTFTQARHAVIDPTAPTGAELLGGYPMLLVPLGVVVATLVVGLWVFARESPRITEHV